MNEVLTKTWGSIIHATTSPCNLLQVVFPGIQRKPKNLTRRKTRWHLIPHRCCHPPAVSDQVAIHSWEIRHPTSWHWSRLKPYGCFLKWWYPQIIHFNKVFHINHPFWGTPILGNPHPYIYIWNHMWATKKKTYFSWNTGCLIGILAMAYEITPG